MHKVKSRSGRPRLKNKRTIISEVYLNDKEVASLKAAAKRYGVPHLSRFIRTAAFSYLKARTALVDTRVSEIIAHFNDVAIDIKDLYDSTLPTDIPEDVHAQVRGLKRKTDDLNELLAMIGEDQPLW